eukprot:m.104320 g.104320  ORF g.104320 m.104320 type:complete len:123 (-) comp20932_c0_seq1:122-490(-)
MESPIRIRKLTKTTSQHSVALLLLRRSPTLLVCRGLVSLAIMKLLERRPRSLTSSGGVVVVVQLVHAVVQFVWADVVESHWRLVLQYGAPSHRRASDVSGDTPLHAHKKTNRQAATTLQHLC